MNFAPFSFLNSQGPTWTPAQMTNLWDWWTASSGVAVNGTNGVTTWTGFNGNVLGPTTAGREANYVASEANLNNQPSINFNTGSSGTRDFGYEVNTPTNQTSKTMILFGHLVSKITSEDNILLAITPNANPRMGLWGSRNTSQYWNAFNDGSGDTSLYSGTTYTNGTKQFIRHDYNRSAGSYNCYASNTNTFTTLANTLSKNANINYTAGKFTVLGYRNGYGTTPRMNVGEVIFINGIPSNDDLTNLSGYLTRKYNV